MDAKAIIEQQMELHRSEYLKLKNILRSFSEGVEKKLTKKEKNIIETNNLISTFHKRRLKKN